jgi:EAL domain-containing protein (putative c-di-GMP-specific phosphodiesterase class I)
MVVSNGLLPILSLSLEDELDADTGGGSLAEMIIELGRALGLKVIAEGVETPTQRQRLIELGCDELQGYLFSPPLPITLSLMVLVGIMLLLIPHSPVLH